MLFEQFLSAFALMLVFEGILPFVYPNHWRNMMRTLLEQDDKFLRGAGLTSMVAGLIMLYLSHQ